MPVKPSDAHDDAPDVTRDVHVEHNDRQAVVHAQRERRRVHDFQTELEDDLFVRTQRHSSRVASVRLAVDRHSNFVARAGARVKEIRRTEALTPYAEELAERVRAARPGLDVG